MDGPVACVRWAAQHSGVATGVEGGGQGRHPPLAAGPGPLVGCPSVDRWWPLERWLGEQRLPEEKIPSLATALTSPSFPEPLRRDGTGDVA